MTDETTQALLPVTVTQADRDLIVTLMRPLAKSAIEHKAIDFIAEGRGDDAEAVQLVAKYRLAHSLPSQADEIAALRARVAEMRELLDIAVEDHDSSMGRSNVPAHWTNRARATLSKQEPEYSGWVEVVEEGE